MTTLHSFLATPWVESLGRTLLHFLWQGAALGTLVWLVLRLARKSPARLRYGLACLAMLAFVAAPVITFFVLPRALPSPAILSSTFVGAPAPQPLPSPEPVGLPATPLTPTTSLSSPDPTPIGPIRPIQSIIPTTPPAPKTDWSWLKRALDTSAPWMVPFWFAGVLLMGARLGFGWCRIQFWRRRAQPANDPDLLAAFLRLAKNFKLGTRVRLLISENAPGPLTFGWLKPVVLLPTGMLTGLPPELLEALLAHELAHIARHDYIFNLLQSAIEVILFYHPAVWWLGRRIRELREECCDELALRACPDRLTYARALESLALWQSTAEPAAAASGGSLVERIARILGRAPQAPATSARHAAGILVLAGFAALSAALVSLAHLQAQTQPANPASKTAPSVPSNDSRAVSLEGMVVLAGNSTLGSIPATFANIHINFVSPGDPKIVSSILAKGSNDFYITVTQQSVTFPDLAGTGNITISGKGKVILPLPPAGSIDSHDRLTMNFESAANRATTPSFTDPSGDMGTIPISRDVMTVISSSASASGTVHVSIPVSQNGNGLPAPTKPEPTAPQMMEIRAGNSTLGSIPVNFGKIRINFAGASDPNITSGIKPVGANDFEITVTQDSVTFPGLNGSGNISVSGNGKLIVAVPPGNHADYSGSMSGDFTLMMSGKGTQSFSGSNKSTRGVIIDSGTLNVNGSSAPPKGNSSSSSSVLQSGTGSPGATSSPAPVPAAPKTPGSPPSSTIYKGTTSVNSGTLLLDFSEPGAPPKADPAKSPPSATPAAGASGTSNTHDVTNPSGSIASGAAGTNSLLDKMTILAGTSPLGSIPIQFGNIHLNFAGTSDPKVTSGIKSVGVNDYDITVTQDSVTFPGLIGNGDLTVTGKGRVILDVPANRNANFGGTISGNFTLLKAGPGTQRSTGNNNSYTGQTVISGGSLIFGGSSAPSSGSGIPLKGEGIQENVGDVGGSPRFFAKTTGGSAASNLSLIDSSWGYSTMGSGQRSWRFGGLPQNIKDLITGAAISLNGTTPANESDPTSSGNILAIRGNLVWGNNSGSALPNITLQGNGATVVMAGNQPNLAGQRLDLTIEPSPTGSNNTSFLVLNGSADSNTNSPGTETGPSVTDGWGEPVNGIQLQLHSDQTQWVRNTGVVLHVDVRNTRSTNFNFFPQYDLSHTIAEVDGSWYGSHFLNLPDLPRGTAVEIKPGDVMKDYNADLRLPLFPNPTKDLKKVDETVPPLLLKPGKHTIRWTLQLGGGAMAASNPVEIEIVDADWLPAATTPAPRNPGLQVYENTKYGFRFEAPKEWKISNKNSSDGRYSPSWFLAINSRRPDLQVIDFMTKPYGNRGTQMLPADSATLDAQLQPGEVNIAIGLDDNHGGISIGRDLDPDSVDTDLRDLLKEKPLKEEGDILRQQMLFSKRGSPLAIRVFMRGPVTQEDRQRLQKILESFRFVDGPVGNDRWAEYLAWIHLPEHLRPIWSAFGGPDGLKMADQKASDGGHLITFSTPDKTEWKFQVSSNSDIKQLSGPVNPQPVPAYYDGWGPAVGGVQLKLSGPLTAYSGELNFYADLRNRNDQPLKVGLPGAITATFVQVDGVWYSSEDGRLSSNGWATIGPRILSEGYTAHLNPDHFFLNPTNDLTKADKSKPLVLTAGKHVLRWSMEVLPGRPDSTNGPLVRVISNPVEIEIPAATK